MRLGGVLTCASAATLIAVSGGGTCARFRALVDQIVGPPAIGVAIFCVVLTDVAGHVGPGDCTAPIAIAP